MQIVSPAREGEMSLANNSSEKDPEVFVDEQFSMWFALAKSHLLPGCTTVRARRGEAEQWVISRS